MSSRAPVVLSIVFAAAAAHAQSVGSGAAGASSPGAATAAGANAAPAAPIASPAPLNTVAFRLMSFSGDVRVERRSGASERVRRAPIELQTADRVVTSADSNAMLELKDRSSVTMGPKTVVRVDEDSLASVRISITLGKLWAKVTRRSARSFEVRGPTMVAAVRGTEFSFEVLDGRRSLVEVHEGKVEVQGLIRGALVGASRLLGPGQRAESVDGTLSNAPEAPGGAPSDGDVREARTAGATIDVELRREADLQRLQDRAQGGAVKAVFSPLSETGAAAFAGGTAPPPVIDEGTLEPLRGATEPVVPLIDSVNSPPDAGTPLPDAGGTTLPDVNGTSVP